MTVRHVRLGVILLAVAMMQHAALADTPDQPGSGKSPTWRLQGRPYGESSVSLGVYHHLTGRWDCGSQISTSLSNENDDDHRDQSAVEHISFASRHSHSRYASVHVNVDMRHWWRIGQRVEWFVGPRIGVGYAYRHTDSFELRIMDDETSRLWSEGKDEDTSLGVGLILGADLELLDHLSVTFALNPLHYWYAWSDSHDTDRRLEEGIETPELHTGKSCGEDGSLTLDATPQLYLVLRLD